MLVGGVEEFERRWEIQSTVTEIVDACVVVGDRCRTASAFREECLETGARYIELWVRRLLAGVGVLDREGRFVREVRDGVGRGAGGAGLGTRREG